MVDICQVVLTANAEIGATDVQQGHDSTEHPPDTRSRAMLGICTEESKEATHSNMMESTAIPLAFGSSTEGHPADTDNLSTSMCTLPWNGRPNPIIIKKMK
jgi:hypothetical protein